MGRGRRRSAEYAEFWPGYVDVLSTLLLVVTFLMSIFMVAQYFATQEAAGKNTCCNVSTGSSPNDQPAVARKGKAKRERGSGGGAAVDAGDAQGGQRKAIGSGLTRR